MTDLVLEALQLLAAIIAFVIGNVYSIFVLFFLFVLLIGPALGRRRNDEAVTSTFKRIQAKRKSRLVTLVHRTESMGFLGRAQLGFIDLNDAEQVLHAITTTPRHMPLEIMLHTPGGLVISAVQIARALKAHQGPTRVYVPHFAMSGGTMIALAADEIIMSEHAILGPVDPQIMGWPAASLVRISEEKSINAISDQTLVLADIGRMSIRQIRGHIIDFMSGTVSDERIEDIADQLSSGQWTHDYPIYATEAKSIGLNVSTDMPSDIMELMALFPDRITRPNRVRVSGLPQILPFGRRSRKSADGRAPGTPIPAATPARQDNIFPATGDGMPLSPHAPQISYGPHLSGRNKR